MLRSLNNGLPSVKYFLVGWWEIHHSIPVFFLHGQALPDGIVMGYIKTVLLPDEHVVYRAVLHWVIYTEGLLLVASGGLVIGLGQTAMNILFGSVLGAELIKPIHFVAGVVVLAGGVLLLAAYVRQVSTELAITNKRVIAKYGFVSRDTFEIMIRYVSGANFDQTVVGRFLGYGTVRVHGIGGELSKLGRIAKPEQFYYAMENEIDQIRSGRAWRVRQGSRGILGKR